MNRWLWRARRYGLVAPLWLCACRILEPGPALEAPDATLIPPTTAREQIAVLGSGEIVIGIAVVFSLAGFPVTMIAVSAEALGRGGEEIAYYVERQVKMVNVTAVA